MTIVYNGKVYDRKKRSINLLYDHTPENFADYFGIWYCPVAEEPWSFEHNREEHYFKTLKDCVEYAFDQGAIVNAKETQDMIEQHYKNVFKRTYIRG